MPRKRKAGMGPRAKKSHKSLKCVTILPAEAQRIETGPKNAVRIEPSIEHGMSSESDTDLNPNNSVYMTEKDLIEIEKNNSFADVTEETKRAIYMECKEMLTGPFMMQKVCAVCDTWTKERLCSLREASKGFYARCRNRLSPSAHHVHDLNRYYDVSTFIPELRNTLISRRGLEKVNENQFQLRVCESCYSSLMRGKEDESCNPPKFSIANGFTIGQLPDELQDVTLTEKRLTSLSIIKGHTVVARGGIHKSIKSHILVFSSQPIAIKEGLDELLKNENKLLLIFTNPMTDAQRKETMRRYQARRDKIGALLNFYLKNNELYRTSTKTGNYIDKLNNIASKSQRDLDNANIVYSTENENISEDIAGDQSNVRRPATFDCAQNAEEEILIHQDASLFTAQRAIEEVTALKLAKAQVIDVQQAGKFLPANTPNYFARIYPHLFPFGHGHPDEKRKVSVSMPECIKHYLKLSSRAFAQDETFPLVAFDIVSRKRSMSHIGLTCTLNPKEIEELNEVSASDLADQLDQEARKRDSFKKGHKFTERVKRQTGKVLLRRVQAVLGKTFATNEERQIYQRKAWNMAAKFHSAAVFITVTPNENGNATVAFFAGSVNKPNLDAIKENDIPGNSARIEISGRDPVACDTFFTNILDILIEKMIGFDVKTKRPRKDGGLFGVPLAFMGGIESQGKGTLHVHLIVFLAGFPKDSDELIQLMVKDEVFKNRVFSFHNSIISSSALENETDSFCPGCECRGSIKPVQINKLAYTNHMQFETPVKTAKCTECSKSFGGDEIIRNSVKFMKKDLIEKQCGHLLHTDLKKRSVEQFEGLQSLFHRGNDSQIAQTVAVPTIPPLPDKSASEEEILAHRIFLIELILLNQNHRWKHAKSCFKKSSNCKDGHCRYNFPRMTQLFIQSDETGRITSKRTIGSEYINCFNEILLQVVRSNHDVRFLLCCAHEIYYTIKYVVKDQNTIDNIAAITLSSYTKKLEKEKSTNVDRTTSQIVYGRIASMAYARSDLIEVGAVTAVHYLLHGTTFVSSHSFQTLHLGKHLNDLNKAENDLGIIPYGRAYIAFNLTSNYNLRPLQLEDECLYDYTEAYYLSRDIPKNIDSNQNCMRLHPEHPFYSTKVVRRRKSRAIADIVGPRIPDLYDINEDDMENYSKIALILFKPHRNSADILGDFKSFTSAFLHFQQQPIWMASQAKRILSNMQQYYIGKRRAHEMRQAQLENLDAVEDNYTDSENDAELYLSNDDSTIDERVPINIESFSSTLKPSTVQHILESLVQKLDNVNNDGMNTNERKSCSSENMRSTVRNTIPRHSLQSKLLLTSWPTNKEAANQPRVSTKEVQDAYSRLQKAGNEQEFLEIHSKNSIEPIRSEETIVRLLEDAIKLRIDSNKPQNDFGPVQDEVVLINPSLAQVSHRFTLNKRQNMAFCIAGSYLLDSFTRSLLLKPPGKPLRMHLSGEGGTGKSRIFDSLRFLAESWGKPDSIVTVAPTGIAAVLIKGETVHSRFQIFHNRKPTMKQIEEWSKVYMIIWDEISMTGQTLFAKAFNKIKLFLGTAHGDEPRVHIVTAGDFAQLPPCFEKFVFAAPAHLANSPTVFKSTEDFKSNEEKVTKYSTKSNLKTSNITGFHLWRSFRIVIKLTENMRHHDDPFYASLLSRLRKGIHTEADFDILNSRALDPAFPNMEVHNEFKQQQENDIIAFPVAVQANISRHSINWLSRAEMARSTGSKEVAIICPAQFNATKRGTKPTLEQMTQLLKIGDNKLQRLSPLLPIFPGMPVYITQNINPKLGLANGSTGTVVGSQFSEDTVFNSTSVQGTTMELASALPEIVYVSVDQKTIKDRFPGVPLQYPISTIPILPHTQTVRVSCLTHRTFSLKMTQMPISPSFAATTHKLQGTTCKAILSYIFNEAGRQPTSLYVLLSRVTKLKGLFLCEKLSSEDFNFFKPSREVLEEENRLDTLCDQTITNYSSGSLFPEKVNKSLDSKENLENGSIENEEIDLYPPKKSKIYPQFITQSTKENIGKQISTLPRQQCQSGSGLSSFDALGANFNPYTVLRIKRAHTLSMFAFSSNLSAVSFNRIGNLNIIPDSELWTVIDVPGDGNCWLYATVLSIYYCSLSFGTMLCIEPQICRNKISSLLHNISNLDEVTRIRFLRHMNLHTSQQGVLLQQVATRSGYANSFAMLSSLLRIGTPYSCLWAGDTGEELALLALVLNQDIVTYSAPLSQESLSRECLVSNIGNLCAGPIYRPYPNISVEQPRVNFRIPILFRNGNHFQAMVPPSRFDMASL